MDSFESVFKYLRMREGYTQAELAEKLGVSKSTISMYENGNRKPDYESLEHIADFFNVDMDFLTARTSEQTSDEDHYYINPETRRLAQEIYQNPDLRILFDASRNLEPDDIQAVANMIKQFKGKSED